ncbi:MAG: tetrahydromethanopterin S-methyltransferase subunit H [Candidatus Hecatellales archaeon]|nr:MAG: tetrahydromethanopterin S-methyltransferase subunit H [Candidatus Hecatellales archaeon]
MFKFEKEQKIYEIAGVKIGGQLGQTPTVLIGSIFYHKHKIVKDEVKGEFDKEECGKLLASAMELKDKTGNPVIVDVCCSYPQAFQKFIDFVAENFNGPLIIDGTTADARIAGAKYVGEVGLSEKVIYNSITPHTKEDEVLAVKEAGIKSAILLTLNAKNPTIAGRLEVVDELITLAEKSGIEKFFVDTTVFDAPDPGPVAKAVYLVKERYGLPAGAGTHNAVDRWKARVKISDVEYMLASTVANVFPIVLGADFILYGPIENALHAHFYCALADAYVAYNMIQEYGIRPLTREHPLFKVFKR